MGGGTGMPGATAFRLEDTGAGCALATRIVTKSAAMPVLASPQCPMSMHVGGGTWSAPVLGPSATGGAIDPCIWCAEDAGLSWRPLWWTAAHTTGAVFAETNTSPARKAASE